MPVADRFGIDESLDRVDFDPNRLSPEPDRLKLAVGDVAANCARRERERVGRIGERDEAAGDGGSHDGLLGSGRLRRSPLKPQGPNSVMSGHRMSKLFASCTVRVLPPRGCGDKRLVADGAAVQ